MNTAASHLPHGLSILVVDDEDGVRELLLWMLEDAGHVPHAAADGAAALDWLQANGPVDVVVSDVNMPHMDGMQLSRRIGELWPGLPVLLISGRPAPAGAKPFLPKPFRWDALVAVIQTITAGRTPLSRAH